LDDADFECAVLSYAKLNNAHLRNAKFPGTILTGAELAGADIEGANLKDAIGLTEAQVYSSQQQGRGAQLPADWGDDWRVAFAQRHS
jgi:uncharacterized protein YjbI with pentapeptide repeats